MTSALYYLASGAIGALVGLAELLGRYRDQPRALFLCTSSWVYILLNASASVVALYLAETLNWSLGIQSQDALMIARLGVASFGAMAVLRTSLFNLKTDDQIVSIGPNAILESLLGAADRGVDRRRAISRSKDASEIMRDISFEKSHAVLSAFCLSLLQNASAQDQQKLRDAVNALGQRQDMTDSQKSMTLGLLLMNLVGPQVLRSAVQVLRDGIQTEMPELTIPPQLDRVAGETVARPPDRGAKRRSKRTSSSSSTAGPTESADETSAHEEPK